MHNIIYIHISNSGNSAGQQCCYDNNGDLTTNPKSGGTLDIVAPSISFIEHMIEDVLPFLYCCKGKVMDNCREYYYQARPSDDGSRYEPPNPGIDDHECKFLLKRK